jgi:hypothetical protein
MIMGRTKTVRAVINAAMGAALRRPSMVRLRSMPSMKKNITTPNILMGSA